MTDETTDPTDAQVQQAQEVISQRAAADAAAEATRVKPITDLAGSASAADVRAVLEAMLPTFLNDQQYGAHINCTLIGLRNLGVPLPAAASSSTASA